MKPLVSILIPAFNSEPFIEQTIESALGQTWPRIEIIVVDDGSKDRTYAKAAQFASDRVSVVTQPNQGAAAARNTAFALSTGDYVQWLDADDLLGPDKIALQLAALPDRRLLLSSGWGHFVSRFQKAKFIPSPLWEDLTPLEWLLRKMEHDVHMQPANWLVSRELTLAAGPWNTRLIGDDDGEYFCRVLLASAGTRFVPGARIYYRITGGGSLSYVGDSDRKLEAQFLSCRMHVEYVLGLDQGARTRAACATYLQKYVGMFYGRRTDLVDQLQQLANGLGARLQAPVLPAKYAWMPGLIGWNRTERARRRYNAVKWSAIRAWDHALLELERKFARQPR